MSLTSFGKAIRKGRIETDDTLRSMSKELDTSPSFLSGLETGGKKISREWVDKISSFFSSRNYHIANLSDLADISNKSVPLRDDIPQQHKMLVAGFANSNFTPDQLKMFHDLLEDVVGESKEGENE